MRSWLFFQCSVYIYIFSCIYILKILSAWVFIDIYLINWVKKIILYLNKCIYLFNLFGTQGDEKRESGNNLPEWVVWFLENKSFFEKCGNHHDLQKSEVNSRYCISCNASICRYCVTTGHHDHKILTIYRHVYQNVVPLSQMDTHIDCDTIQVRALYMLLRCH